ncbi:hypothetical protein [Catenuloplanes japonicus]|uniref:hypothetical protein n=1 Tax=Catenuloplanes japonicus TaxID=33876 RepID=UPI0012F86063|nr:hypothetical protein [Catenuloplanes japonicus]
MRSLLFQTTGKSRERAECPGSRLLALALEVSTPQPKINDLCRLLGGRRFRLKHGDLCIRQAGRGVPHVSRAATREQRRESRPWADPREPAPTGRAKRSASEVFARPEVCPREGGRRGLEHSGQTARTRVWIIDVDETAVKTAR